MAFYSLLIVDKQETVSGIAARDRAEAVAMFGRQLGRDLTLDDDDTCVAQYLLDEWSENPHWVYHTIPVFARLREAQRRLVQKLGRHRQIDLRPFEVGMAEIGGEQRQPPLHIGALAIPGGQAVDREAMPEIMEAWDSSPASRAVDAGDAPQAIERSMRESFAAGGRAVTGEGASDSGAASAGASDQAGGSGAPAWARRMKRNQTINHGVSAAHQAIRSGDHPSSGGGVDLSEGE